MTKKLFLIWFTLYIVIAGWIVGAILKWWMPQHYIECYPFIPVFFYCFGWFYIYMFDACRKYSPEKIQLVYLGGKFIKLILSLAVLLLYTVKVQTQKIEFVVLFFSFYILTLAFESVFFYRFEKRKKKVETNITGTI